MTAPSIVVVGAGASGCYAAQALRKALPEAEITVLERLPVPFGLLRYGVAADHQGTKGVQHQFERLLASQVSFVGGLELGHHIDLGQLTDLFDIVVLATGVPQDRRLGVDGDTLPGVIGAGRLTRALNSHPEDCMIPPVVGQRVAIIGSGNVAVDILRLLSRSAEEWDGSDMDEDILARIIPQPVNEIHLVARATAEAAHWDAAMIRELAGLRRPSFRLAGGAVDPASSPAASALFGLLAASPQVSGELTVNFHFQCIVEAIIGKDAAQGLRIKTAGGERRDLAVNTVVTAIGFDWTPHVMTAPRVYTTGWLRTGPQGTIPHQRTLAKQVVSEIVTDLRSGLIATGRPGRRALPAGRTTNFDSWIRIDEVERARAAAGRTRRKITSIEQMYDVACSSRSRENV